MNNMTQQHSKPLGELGSIARYRHEKEDGLPSAVVKNLDLVLGPVEESGGMEYQWFRLHATKANGEKFNVCLLSTTYPPQTLASARKSTARYILQEGDSEPLEFRDRFTGEAVLPVLGGWEYLFPRAADKRDVEDKRPACSDMFFPQKVKYLGHLYLLEHHSERSRRCSFYIAKRSFYRSPKSKVLELLPDVLIGPAHNTKQKDETRRYDNSDYELVRLTKDDYSEMIDAGINCLRVDAEQAKWIERSDVFYWGIGGDDVSYPECLYRSNYLGPGIFMDEPAVCTRDHVIRPRLEKDEDYRKALTVQMAFEEFRKYFRTKREGAPTRLLKGLSARSDVDLGDMEFLQQNIYTWETMVSSAAYQLAEDVEQVANLPEDVEQVANLPEGRPPNAIVFEPPARVGTMRTLPEINMTYGCQIPISAPKNLTDIIYGFLRGAARLTGKSWGMSIYGQLHRADAFWYQTHAYELGATLFLYWDSHELACVPYSECLALSRNLRAHAESHPHRDLKRLKRAGEVAILLPPGYGLGHVDMGRGNLWGLGELNLERINREGVKYRVVMSNFFTEIERCIRLGVAFDLIWDLDGLDTSPTLGTCLSGYREIVRVREDGKVELFEDGKKGLREGARKPIRPSGIPPQLIVELSTNEGNAPLSITARATIVEGSAAVYYTVGANAQGVYRNELVPWELFGPEEEDYRFLNWEWPKTRFGGHGAISTVEVDFRIERPGNYRLRAATVDMAGRTAVVWKTITVKD